MKVFLVLLVCPLLAHSIPVESTELSIEPVDNYGLVDDVSRFKRAGASGSGGFDIFTHLKQGLVSGIGKASAQVASGSSGTSSSASSSKGHSSGHPTGHGEEGKFDAVGLKKSILNTIFQAVKAITGGVTAIKGQLIKGSGYAISAKGKLVQSSGDAVSNVGKKLVASANLIPGTYQEHSSGNHLGKLSSISSLSSASASASGSLSSSSSSASSSSASSSSHHTGPTGHSESFTSYEEPSHTGYSAGHSSQSQDYGTASPHNVNAYLPPSGHGHSSSGAYVGNKYSQVVSKPLNNYYLPADDTAIRSSSHGTQNTADVLRQILDNISKDKHSSTLSETVSYQTDNTYKTAKKVVEQYEIPPDPLPAFKPLKHYLPSYSSGIPLGPIETVSHTHSLTTAYASPPNQFSYVNIPKSHESAPPVSSVHDHNYVEPNPYNMYHSLTLKLATNPTIPPPISKPHSAAYLQYGPPSIDTHPNFEAFGLGGLGKYEIQKSVSYELNDPTLIQKRILFLRH